MEFSKDEGAQAKELAEKKITGANPQPRPTPPPPKQNSFWTICRNCNMCFEFLRNYLNQTIRCPECREPFLAIEVPSPSLEADTSSEPSFFPQHKQVVRGPSNLQKASEQMKKQHEDSAKDAVIEAAIQNKRNRPTKKRRVNVADSAGNSIGTVNQMAPESGDCAQGNSSQQKGRFGGARTAVRGNKPEKVAGWSKSKVRHVLMAEARMGILKKLNERRAEDASSVSSLKEDGDN